LPGQSGRPRPVDERIAFTFPASYWSVIDLKDAPSGSQRLGIEVWSRSLDPLAPDRIRARELCGNAPCPPEIDPFLPRRDAGEFAVRVEVTSVIGTEAHTQRVLGARSGLNLGELYAGRPCAIGCDEAHDLITVSVPEGVPPYKARNFSGHGSRSREGVVSQPRHFAKANPDGSLRYVVRCTGYTDDPRGRGGSCQLQGYFGIWPLFMWVDADRIEEWDAVYTRVSDLLARHVAHRTDTPPQKDAAL
jgi:hypothetical protein